MPDNNDVRKLLVWPGQTLAETAEILKNDEVVHMLHSGETLAERVAEITERQLFELIRKFQSESNETNANRQWKQIERMVFGVPVDEFHATLDGLVLENGRRRAR